MKLIGALCFANAVLAQGWTPVATPVRASLRGVSAVDGRTVWASGSGGTWMATSDGGATWRTGQVAGAETLDFRGIRAIDARTVFLMSAGPGEMSRIYKTTDGGERWTLLHTNAAKVGFFDAIAFWDARRGIVVGDPVEDHAEVLTTDDGGAAWQQQSPPEAIPGEGSFAASNSCLTVYGERDAWFATGGPDGARVFHSSDSGRTWSAAATPMRNDSASAGIFSLAFRDARHGIAAGGDYAKDKEARGNLALTSDGGRTWVVPKGAGPRGFRSAAAWAGGDVVIVTGSSGSEISRDGGNTWQGFDDGAYHALSFAAGTGWAVGPEGRVARYRADGK